jgi:hypothetical protein
VTVATLEELVFQVPVRGPIPGAPMAAEGRLVLTLADGRAKRLALELRPSQAAFMAKLPKLLAETGFPGDVFAHGRAGSEGQPVLTYEAGPATLARVPQGLATMAQWLEFLAPGPPVLDLTDYSLAAIAFES